MTDIPHPFLAALEAEPVREPCRARLRVLPQAVRLARTGPEAR